MDTLVFGYILPPAGRISDFHRLETCAAGRTTKGDRGPSPVAFYRCSGQSYTSPLTHRLLYTYFLSGVFLGEDFFVGFFVF